MYTVRFIPVVPWPATVSIFGNITIVSIVNYHEACPRVADVAGFVILITNIAASFACGHSIMANAVAFTYTPPTSGVIDWTRRVAVMIKALDRSMAVWLVPLYIVRTVLASSPYQR